MDVQYLQVGSEWQGPLQAAAGYVHSLTSLYSDHGYP